MKHLKRLLLSTMLIFASIAMYAQTEIKGTVVDEFGEPVMMATVLQKGTGNGTTTDLDGNFSLTVDEGAILVFSFVGYTTKEVPASKNMHVVLSEDSQLMEEVVVTGSA